MWMSVIAYNLGNLWRRLVKTARVDKACPQPQAMVGESTLMRLLFGSMLWQMEVLPAPGG
jgi:hypothetical protein